MELTRARVVAVMQKARSRHPSSLKRGLMSHCQKPANLGQKLDGDLDQGALALAICGLGFGDRLVLALIFVMCDHVQDLFAVPPLGILVRVFLHGCLRRNRRRKARTSLLVGSNAVITKIPSPC